MATFSQQYGQLGQQANPAISDATQNKNPGGFPNVAQNMRAKPAQIMPLNDARISGMQRLPGPGPQAGPMRGGTPPFSPGRGAPMIDQRFYGGFGGPRGPMNGNQPGVGAFGVPAGSLGRIEKGAWNDPNRWRGAGGPMGRPIGGPPMGIPGGGTNPNWFGGGGASGLPPGAMVNWSGGGQSLPFAMPANDQAAQEMMRRRAMQQDLQGIERGGPQGGSWGGPQQTQNPNPRQAAAPITDGGGGITANGPGMAGGGK